MKKYLWSAEGKRIERKIQSDKFQKKQPKTYPFHKQLSVHTFLPHTLVGKRIVKVSENGISKRTKIRTSSTFLSFFGSVFGFCAGWDVLTDNENTLKTSFGIVGWKLFTPAVSVFVDISYILCLQFCYKKTKPNYFSLIFFSLATFFFHSYINLARQLTINPNWRIKDDKIWLPLR